ncbi:4Fe-4S binding protein [Sporomusa sp. KB1]|uniref:4Fe-4S binding protein n=1 Tax=Sporomusa sp. KB1 TaxID=943346 RepID=UPI0011A116AA|nr:4Fe-4S binding protein [Sporomusa sp. KB1]
MSRNRTRTLRITTMAVVAVTIIIGAVKNAGTGSLSAFGVENIAAICPLGYLETALAGRELLPHLLVSFLVIAGLTALLGRVFCGWICPIPLVRKLVVNKVDEGQQSFTNSTTNDDSAQAILADGEITTASGSQESSGTEKNSTSGLVILGVTLGSSAIFGFPVFCLICPIGLVFGTLFALIRLLHFNEPSFDLIVFPVIIIVELVLLKKWCSKLCPVGALLSLFSRFNRTLVPTVDRSLCLEESHDTKCQRCRSACSFDVDLKNGSGTGGISDCIKCRECADHCPVQAIRFPWR